jgi:predicted MPP superfamily phosphohydrolase
MGAPVRHAPVSALQRSAKSRRKIRAAAHAIMFSGRSGLKAWPVFAILVIQGILFLGHWLVFSTVVAAFPCLSPAAIADLRATIFVLAFTFVAASLLAFRFSNFAVHLFYTIAAAWLGFVNFFFWASLLVRLVWLVLPIAHLTRNPAAARSTIAGVFFALAALAGVYGLINARIIRVRHVTLQLPHLPAPWRGRRGVLLSDLHLGPVNGARFCRRVVGMAARFQPDIVFLPGDLFDGTHADLDRLVAPFRTLTPPCGAYFSTGNHEEFTNASHYVEAVARAGIRVLANESVVVEGLQIAGVPYHDSTHIIHMKAFLDSLHLDRSQPCILLNHAPTRLPLVEQAGVALQLSGHTHGGQFFPFTWLTRRIFGKFTTGLNRFGALQVYTSTGAGTWGPPLRVGSASEMVVFTFE